MFSRFLAAGALAILLSSPALALDRAPKPPPTSYKAPRAADGHPDLQGTWTNATLTRLERDAKFGSRIELTQAEVDALEGRNKQLIELGNRPTNPNATVADLPADCSGGRGRDCNYNAAWTDPGTVVMRVAGKPRSGFITTTPNGRIPAMTKEGQARMQAAMSRRGRGSINDNPETRSLGERCILSFGNSAGPVMLPLLYNNTYEIVQTKDHVAIVVEMVHDVRNVRMNAKHLPASIRPYMGDSIGWWEGDTLVIETTNFHPAQNFRGASENLKVTERLTRVAPDRIHYSFWVEDPTTWVEPWGGEYEFGKSNGALYEYACHEGNYGLENILSGARSEERTGVKTAPTNIDQAGGEDGGDES
ncbi:hypothetical protein [Phenylobacterium sp.]|jgi:hypothetical protein|uniref:hypothetical protein n=1 Tax=Phenylobacterium sp. TaxID=1871053 RepID=UPI002F949AA4